MGSRKGAQDGRLLPAADPLSDRLDELLVVAEDGYDHHQSGVRHVSGCHDVNFQHECPSRHVEGRPHA
jgi:hypothetical protein